MSIVDYLRIFWHALKAARAAARATMRSETTVLRNAGLVRGSEFFDAEWYLKNNPDVAASGVDPALHYAVYGVKSGRNPSPYFVNDEYYALHNDVRSAQMNPLVHFELFGKKEGREISLLEVKEPRFPEGCEEGTWRFGRVAAKHRRTAVVASYFGDGRISAALVYLLTGLREVVDNVVFVADCKVLPDEMEKLRGLVTLAKVERHGQYDFGSYRRGLELCRSEGLLEIADVDELVFINDSNYGPVFPFSESFSAMSSRPCDFWGYTGYNAFGNRHISSYFYVFRRPVVDSGNIDEFLKGVQGRLMRDNVIVRFELRMTKWLQDNGFAWETYVPFGVVPGSPMKYPLVTLGKYRTPLLKVKVVNGDSYDDHQKVLSLLEKVNPELRRLITVRPLAREHYRIGYAEHQDSFPSKCQAIAAKAKRGEKVRAMYFVTSASMFPAVPLYLEMKGDALFDPKICVIPDVRWGDGKEIAEMERCEKELAGKYGADSLVQVRPDEYGAWPDVLEGVDIVAYPSPYELSKFRYNPRYSVGRRFLPICVNYGYYRSKYDRVVMAGQSYAYMWKAFFECEETVAEYRKYSAVGGSNADLVGYVKMDALAAVARTPHSRKRILVAMHHSVDGGTNKMLSLANFIEYADFFQKLPERYPEIDFVFRPHPFLFKVMARTRKWSEDKVANYVKCLRAKENVIWSDGGDYFREFAESDGCIQDCGSFLVEYFYTGKPCCYMLKSPEDITSKFSPLGEKCLSHCYLAYDTQAIDDFIRRVVVDGCDEKASGRNEFAKTIAVNYPHAARVALNHIKSYLS